MLCPRCGREKREAAKYCGNFRASLVSDVTCPDSAPPIDGTKTFATSGVRLWPKLPLHHHSPHPNRQAISDRPDSFADGRYQLIDFLGESLTIFSGLGM